VTPRPRQATITALSMTEIGAMPRPMREMIEARHLSAPSSRISDTVAARLRRFTYYWEKPSTGGDPKAQQCGWLKDKYGLSWQIVPTVLPLLKDHESEREQRAMAATLRMSKLDIGELERAAAG
jgi:predicted 3-demethylubiquinone-9 3-methyltransferase (glyoxalase superfamily)